MERYLNKDEIIEQILLDNISGGRNDNVQGYPWIPGGCIQCIIDLCESGCVVS